LQAAAEKGDTKAAFSIEVFGRSIRKTIAAYAAVLGGVDMLVFTGGIGENSAIVRAKATQDLAFMGIEIDDAANQQNRTIISQPGSACQVRVIPTDEDLQIARHAHDLLAG
jgi:acetate kinase